MMMGADYYQTEQERGCSLAAGNVPLGIGENTKIRNCIIDKNAGIGKNVVIANLWCYPKKEVCIGEPEGCKCPEGFKGNGNTCEGKKRQDTCSESCAKSAVVWQYTDQNGIRSKVVEAA